MWIYVIYQAKKQLMYIMKKVNYEGDFNYQPGDINTIADNSKLNHTYKVEVLYQFKKPITLPELKRYKNRKTQKSFHPSENISYVSSYPELIEDIITEKI